MNPKERPSLSIESSTPVAEPIEIFPGPQEIQNPVFKKTRLMGEVEQLIQGDLPKFLERKYCVERLSQDDISQAIRDISEGHIQISDVTILDWMRRFNIAARSMSAAAELAWQNPEKRKRKIEKIHSPTADRKRSEAMRNNWQSLSASEKRDRLKRTREERRRALLRRMREALGENPTERLREMRSRLSLREIGEELGKNRSTVKGWMKLEIETRKRAVNTERIGFIKADEERKQNLVREARINGIIIILDPKEQFVIDARFPTKGTTAPLTQIGRNLDPNRPVQFSREYIRQIQEKALRKLANGDK